MATTNDITGDPIQTKLGISNAYADNYDRIFGNKPKQNPINAEIDKVLDKLKHIATLCGKHDRMDLMPKLEQAYDTLEQMK